MRRTTARDLAWVLLGVLTFPAFSRAQPGNPQDQAIDEVRRQQNISAGDQDFIRRWVEWEVGHFDDFAEFRGRFQSQYNNANNTPQFQRELAVQSTQTAVQRFGGGPLAGNMPHSLAQVLLDMHRVETVPALLAGLGVKDARTRYLCARGLVAQQRAIGADQAVFTRTIDAVRKAGLAETEPVVLGRIYEVLAFSAAAQVPTVFAAYAKLFDQRLDLRRKTTGVVDGAELHAYEFFLAAGVIDALNAVQQADLTRRLAVFHRLDAEHYNEYWARVQEWSDFYRFEQGSGVYGDGSDGVGVVGGGTTTLTVEIQDTYGNLITTDDTTQVTFTPVRRKH